MAVDQELESLKELVRRKREADELQSLRAQVSAKRQGATADEPKGPSFVESAKAFGAYAKEALPGYGLMEKASAATTGANPFMRQMEQAASPGQQPRSFSDQYAENIRGSRERLEKEQALDPRMKWPGTITGSIPGLAIPGGQTLLGKIGLTAAESALDAGTRNPETLFDPQAAAIAGGIGGGAAGALGAIGGKLAAKGARRPSGPTPVKGPSIFGDKAAEQSFKAAAGGVDKVYTETPPEAQKRIGQTLLGETGEKPIVTFGATAKTIAERTKKAQSKVWNERVQPTIVAAQEAGSYVKGEDVAKRLQDIINGIPATKANASKIKYLEDVREEMLQADREIMNIDFAQELKNQYTFKKKDITKPQYEVDAESAVNQALGKEIVKTVESSGVEGAIDFGKNYRLYGDYATALKGATTKAKREAKNLGIGLRDIGAATAGTAAGASIDPETATTLGVLGALGSKVARTRGSSAAAVTYRAISKVEDALRSSPQAMRKYLPKLNAAATRSPNAFTATHVYLLQSEPEYRSLVLGEPSVVAQGE